ncbi:hypothetical protein HDV00_011744 [Rhizophlyctis rosea]|nr:hypothetical protein HDV00_011744 [Rhizophlyctis rosea]
MPRSPNPPPNLPTAQTITTFLQTFFPSRPRDVPFIYHSPRHPTYTPATARIDRIILSITPTPTVYTSLNDPSPLPPLLFLHRPFTLDRKRVRRGASVLASHVGFDEVLTTGWNVALADRLGVDVGKAACLAGYKGDPARRIGLVGAVRGHAQELCDKIREDFSGCEGVFGIDLTNSDRPIRVLAIMNAFHPEEVERVLTAAVEKGWIASQDDGSDVLYLTGAVREPGLAAAMEKRMAVVCVGHRPCEEWGIKYLASRLREEFNVLKVEEIYEGEEPLPPKTTSNRGRKGRSGKDENVTVADQVG